MHTRYVWPPAITQDKNSILLILNSRLGKKALQVFSRLKKKCEASTSLGKGAEESLLRDPESEARLLNRREREKEGEEDDDGWKGTKNERNKS